MKKHAGKVIHTGLLTSAFGLILMGGNLIANMILKASDKPSDVVESISTSIGEASWTILIIGAVVLALGLFMHTKAD